jgi:hypothetical protein
MAIRLRRTGYVRVRTSGPLTENGDKTFLDAETMSASIKGYCLAERQMPLLKERNRIEWVNAPVR